MPEPRLPGRRGKKGGRNETVEPPYRRYQVSIPAREGVYTHSKHRGRDLHALVRFADFSAAQKEDDENTAFRSLGDIAQDLRMSHAGAKDLVRRLRTRPGYNDKPELELVKRGSKNGGASVYRIMLPLMLGVSKGRFQSIPLERHQDLAHSEIQSVPSAEAGSSEDPKGMSHNIPLKKDRVSPFSEAKERIRSSKQMFRDPKGRSRNLPQSKANIHITNSPEVDRLISSMVRPVEEWDREKTISVVRGSGGTDLDAEEFWKWADNKGFRDEHGRPWVSLDKIFNSWWTTKRSRTSLQGA